ncbi:MAG: hypothetical protein KGZ74_09745 [Chitinophagaceae bacterium]|nr:hypothetical protein [Chitinophagaceae bacterium]
MIKQIFIYLLVMVTVAAKAQQPQKPTPTLTPPQLQSFWGTTKGGSLPLEFVLNVVDSGFVWVIDDKKVKYNINRFIVIYRSKDRFEDEQTGEIKSRFNNNSLIVKNTGIIEEKWRKMMYENIKVGDELWITDIIVRDKKGEYIKAPDVKITIN